MLINLFKKNLNLKIFAVILAIVLWIYVNKTQDPFTVLLTEINMIIDLKTINTPKGLVPVELPETCVITIIGSQESINKMKNDDIKAYIDLEGKSAGSMTCNIDVKTPPGIKVNNIKPSFVTVTIDKIEKKSFPVDIVPEGNPQKGFLAGKPELKNTSVTFEGPSLYIKKISSVKIYADLNGLDDDFIQNMSPVPFDSNSNPIKGLISLPAKIPVKIPVRSEYYSKTVPVRPSLKGTPSAGYEIEYIKIIPPIAIINCPRNKSLNYIETQDINIDGAKNFFEKDVSLKIPDYIISADKQSVRIIIKFIKIRLNFMPSKV